MGGRGLKPTSCRETSREVWKVSHAKSGQAPDRPQLLSLWAPWAESTQGRQPLGRSLEKAR